MGAGMFVMSVWIRAEPSFEEWIQILDIYAYYIGVYILITASVIVIIVSFLGCCAALMEHTQALLLVSILYSKCHTLTSLVIHMEKAYRTGLHSFEHSDEVVDNE